MTQYRRSYAKTALMAAIGGTGCLVIGLLFLCGPAMELPGMHALLWLPMPIRIIAGAICIGIASFGFSIAAGGVLALHYAAKGRAVFE
jgi:hypothetical protein